MTEYDKCKNSVIDEIDGWMRDKEFRTVIIEMITNEIWQGCENYEDLIYYAKYINQYEGE